jgi:hypothetical protein
MTTSQENLQTLYNLAGKLFGGLQESADKLGKELTTDNDQQVAYLLREVADKIHSGEFDNQAYKDIRDDVIAHDNMVNAMLGVSGITDVFKLVVDDFDEWIDLPPYLMNKTRTAFTEAFPAWSETLTSLEVGNGLSEAYKYYRENM